MIMIMPEQSSNPRHETLDSFSWFNCYNADLRAALVCFCMTFDLIFETRPISLVNFCLQRLTLPFGGIYIPVVIKLVPPERDCCWDKRRIIYNLPYIYIYIYVYIVYIRT